MNPVIKQLVELTAVDRAAQALREQLALYPKMLADLDTSESALSKREADAKTRFKAGREALRKVELDIAALKEQITKYTLQQGQVKTNKEYHAITEEIQGVKSKIDVLETSGIEHVVAEEEADDQEKAAARELNELKKEHTVERSRIQKQIEEKQARLKEFEAEHASLVAALPEENQELYELLNHRYPGTGVVPVRDGSCGGCNVHLVSQYALDARLGEKIVRCDNCTRILYDAATVGKG